jgi:hypothetical protein
VEFEQLDFIYSPCRDVAAETAHFAEVIGARVVFAIDGMGARVAMLELAGGPPHLLLADHLQGDRPILIYRVADLADATKALKDRGLELEGTLEIPIGPCSSFTTPGGHRVAVYQRTRPEVLAHFEGRRDF